jgi:hypothetical protein
MAFEKKDGQGALFKNARKESPSHPDYRGDVMIDGREYWLSAWIKEGKSGKFMSIAVKPKDEQPRRQEPTITQRAQATIRRPDPISSGRQAYDGRDMDDQDVPF